MFKRKALLISALAVLMTFAGACTSDTLDDGDSADVIMEILVLQNPPVTATLDTMTSTCTFTIEDWQVDVANEPKNEFALAPFNDIEMVSVSITYNWISNPPLTTPTRVIGLGGVTIPTSTSSQIVFTPISFDDLSATFSGHTANLVMTFEARTVEGTRITKTVLRQLNVESCA